MSGGLKAAVAVALLASGLSLVPMPGSDDRGARAAAPDCSWQRQAKRVVTHVKRHGQFRRLVRTRHWWACIPVLAAPAGTGSPAPPSAPAPPPPSAPTAPELPKVEWLGVTAKEWSLTLSRSSIAPGEVIVELNNEGMDAHNLDLQREGDAGPPLKISATGSQAHRSARFTLVAGTYQLWCDLPEHKEEGMSVSLEVGGG